jgi:hypothetical protein
LCGVKQYYFFIASAGAATSEAAGAPPTAEAAVSVTAEAAVSATAGAGAATTAGAGAAAGAVSAAFSPQAVKAKANKATTRAERFIFYFLG